MLKTISLILKTPKYLFLATLSSISLYVFLVVISNINLFQNTLFRPDFSVQVKTAVFSAAVKNSFDASGVTTFIIAILLGLNIAVITFYFRNKISAFKAHSSATSFLGALIGIIGLGCAACGSFILTSLLPFFGLGALFTFLPFHGKEFGIIGILLLLISLYLTLKEIQNPKVCKIS